MKTRENKEAKIGYDGKPIQKVKPNPAENHYSFCGSQPRDSMGDGTYWYRKIKGCE
jgi:hypothetical protein